MQSSRIIILYFQEGSEKKYTVKTVHYIKVVNFPLLEIRTLETVRYNGGYVVTRPECNSSIVIPGKTDNP